MGGAVRVHGPEPLGLGLAEQLVHAGVAVLDVVDGVVGGLRLRHLQVELQVGVRLAGQEIEARRVHADLVHHLP